MLLTERHQIGEIKVDRDAGVIRNAKIIGTTSRNGRTYPIDVLAAAAPLYEGATCNVDHSTETSRPLLDTFGAIRNVRVERSGSSPGLYGDIHYNRKHGAAEQIAEAAERFPEKLGLSHNADGTGKRSSAGFLVEKIDRVVSVDLVGQPATTKSLFEGYDPMNLRTVKLKDLIGSLPASHEKRTLTRLVEEGAMSGDTAVAVEEQPSPEAAINAVFRVEVVKVLDDPDLDFKGRLGRIKEILKAQEKVMAAMSSATGTGEPKDAGSTPPDATDQEPTAESLKGGQLGALLEEIKALRKEVSASKDSAKLTEQLAGREVTPEQFSALLAIPADKRAVLIEAMGKPKGASTPKPRTTGSSSATSGGSNNGDQKPYGTGKNFKEHLIRPGRVGNLN